MGDTGGPWRPVPSRIANTVPAHSAAPSRLPILFNLLGEARYFELASFASYSADCASDGPLRWRLDWSSEGGEKARIVLEVVVQMADRFRVLSVMGRQLESMGISTNAVLRLAGLPAEIFQQTRIWLTTEEMRALYDAIAEVSGDQAIGLRLGSEERPENYSPIAIAALFTRSFRDALNRVARYKRLTSPQEIRLSERGRECAVEFL